MLRTPPFLGKPFILKDFFLLSTVYQIEDWTRLNQFVMFEEQEKNVVLNENSAERKPCINRESKSLELTIQLLGPVASKHGNL